MRHRKKGRKLGRTSSHRKATFRNMVTSFFELGQIETTDAKAKELRSLAERLVTVAKRGSDDLTARRQVLRVVRSKKVVAKLFDEIAPRYADRPGGYTRIIKVASRRGDAAPLSILQFVMEPVTFKERKPRADEGPDEVIRAVVEEPPADDAEAAVDATDDVGEGEEVTDASSEDAPSEEGVSPAGDQKKEG
ncbi:50S ribosomal protein L17 [bacterium]|nr:50S ribosomal protein L17 [bacterium]